MMDAQKARQVLQNYRPGVDDENDASIREALSYLDQNPALASWFNQEQAFDNQVSKDLESIRIPTNLKEAIMEKVYQAESTSTFKKNDSPTTQVTWWQNHATVITPSIAALFVFLFTLTFVLLDPEEVDAESSFASYTDFVAHHAYNEENLHIHNTHFSHIQKFLYDRQYPVPQQEDLPKPLSHSSSQGATLTEWQSFPVSVLAWEHPQSQQQSIQIFVTPHHGLTLDETLLKSQKVYRQHPQKATVSWINGELLYTIVADGSVDKLRGWVDSPQ